MPLVSPITTPGAFDFITLDGQRTPGTCKRTSGGNRSYKIDDAQAPGFGGAYTIFRFEEISKIVYRFSVWYDPGKPTAESVAAYAALEAFLASLVAGNKKRPPKSYRFLDLYLGHNGIGSVIVADVGGIEKDEGKMRWSAEVRFSEHKKLRIFGGKPREKTAQEKDNESKEDRNQKAREELRAKIMIEAARRQGEGRWN
jgi:hypothetical protein